MPLAQKNGRRDVYKTRQKTSIRKVRTYVQNVPKKGTPKSDFFDVFWGLGPKALQGGPKGYFWYPRVVPIWSWRCPGVAPGVTFGTPGWAQGFLLAPSNLTLFQNGRDSENKSWESRFRKDAQGMRT